MRPYNWCITKSGDSIKQGFLVGWLSFRRCCCTLLIRFKPIIWQVVQNFICPAKKYTIFMTILGTSILCLQIHRYTILRWNEFIISISRLLTLVICSKKKIIEQNYSKYYTHHCSASVMQRSSDSCASQRRSWMISVLSKAITKLIVYLICG